MKEQGMANQADRAEFLERVGAALGVGLPDGVEAAYVLVKSEGEGLGKTQRWRDAGTRMRRTRTTWRGSSGLQSSGVWWT
jgi:hypothetical protein